MRCLKFNNLSSNEATVLTWLKTIVHSRDWCPCLALRKKKSYDKSIHLVLGLLLCMCVQVCIRYERIIGLNDSEISWRWVTGLVNCRCHTGVHAYAFVRQCVNLRWSVVIVRYKWATLVRPSTVVSLSTYPAPTLVYLVTSPARQTPGKPSYERLPCTTTNAAYSLQHCKPIYIPVHALCGDGLNWNVNFPADITHRRTHTLKMHQVISQTLVEFQQ